MVIHYTEHNNIMTIYLNKTTIETNVSLQYLSKLIADNIDDVTLLSTRNENRIAIVATKVVIGGGNKDNRRKIKDANTFYNIEIGIDITKIRRIEL